MQSMLNRVERFKLGEADFRDESRDFLRGKDIFVDAEDRHLFKKACPIEFDRIERRERADTQEVEKRLAQETAALLLEKLDDKLGRPEEHNFRSTSSSASLSVATETKTGVVDSEAKQQLMRALDDRKAYMVEALQMEIALMINQHKIIDDYQSPVNGSMYSESPHVVSLCTARAASRTRATSFSPPSLPLAKPILEPHLNALRLQSSCGSSRRSASARKRSRNMRT